MFSPHPEVIIEQVGLDGGLQVGGGKRQVFVIKLGFSRGGSDAALWET